MRKYTIKGLAWLGSALDSRWGVVFAMVPFVLGSLWVALFFRTPLLYDEQFHFNATQIFSHQISPVVIHQPPAYDIVGNMTFGSAGIYHYLMSWPLRIVAHFTQNHAVQVVVLRLINIGLAGLGLLFFSKLFADVGIRKRYSNLAVFIYANIPMVTVVAATVNYDNMLLPLTALFLIFSVKLARGANTWLNWVGWVITGIFAALVKFTFLPIFLSVFILLCERVYKSSVKNTKREVINSARKSNKYLLAALGTVLIILFGLSALRYGVSILRYHTPIPACAQTMSLERCRANPVVMIEQNILRTRGERKVDNPVNYSYSWVQMMIGGFALTTVNSTDGLMGWPSPSLFVYMLSLGLAFTGFVTVYCWKTLKKPSGWDVLLVAMVSLTLSAMLFSMQSYYEYHRVINAQPRYLLSILLIYIVFGVVSLANLIMDRHWVKASLVLLLLFFVSQGGGFITHALQSTTTWYWQNDAAFKINENTKRVIGPMVIDDRFHY